MQDVKNIQAELKKMIKELEWKLEALPERYFINYVEEIFIPSIKTILKSIY